MSSTEEKMGGNPGYAAGQLAKALQTLRQHPDPAVRQRAADKVRRFEQVLAGMAAGSLAVGSRAPVAGAPPWVTLEVAHGGFPTGAFLASGAELPHEAELRARLGLPGGDRAALNRHHLSDEGLAALRAQLESGRYRVQVPEEGALLVTAWLLEHGESAAAIDLLDTLAPFFDRLRFYPVPAAAPLPATSVARLASVAEVRVALQGVRTPPRIERMNEQLRYFTPLYDRAVALFLETVTGPPPTVRCGADGAPERRPGGAYQIDGGWPCQVYPQGWAARAAVLLDEYAAARRAHPLCGKPEDPKENFAVLRGLLAQCAKNPRALSGRDVGMVRKVLATFAHRHGAPGSPRREATRAMQARIAGLPTNQELARALAQRLAPYPAEGGVPDVDLLTGPLRAEERAALGATATRALPPSLHEKILRCLEAPIAELTERGVIPSAEVLALVLPQISAQVRAARFAEPRLRALYGAIYAAFRRRRSLLLLNLEHQVRFDELPWVAVLGPFQSAAPKLQGRKGGQGGTGDPRAADTLREVAALALAAFPERIVPNKLLSEMVALAKDAGLDLPLTEELAADIFMGAFGLKFVRAAQGAARLLAGTPYARYYALPCARVLALDDVDKKWGVQVSPGFLALCEERSDRAAAVRASPVARNGAVIEQSQVLTSHNLAALWQGLDLGPLLSGRAPELARRCFRYACERLQAGGSGTLTRHAQLLALKDAAYAFRQMLFFLSVGGPSSPAEAWAWIEADHGALPAAFRTRFAPAMAGLRHVLGGGELPRPGHELQDGARRLLGWAVGPHWLIAPP